MFCAATKSAINLPPSISYITVVSDDSNLTTYTFSGVSFGSSTERSLVIVGVSGRQGSNIQVSSVTIGGTSATEITKSNAENACTGIYAAAATGTSGNIVVTFNSGADAAAIGVWAAYNLTSTSAFSSASANDTLTTVSANINTPSSGIVVAVGSINSGTLRTVTWTGVTERYDAAFSSTRTYTGGDFTTTSGESPRSISYLASGSVNNLAISSASWR